MKNKSFTCCFEGFLDKFTTLFDYKTSKSTSISYYTPWRIGTLKYLKIEIKK